MDARLIILITRILFPKIIERARYLFLFRRWIKCEILGLDGHGRQYVELAAVMAAIMF